MAEMVPTELLPPCTPPTYQFTPSLLVPETVAANACDWPPATVAAVGEITMAIGPEPEPVDAPLEPLEPLEPLLALELPLFADVLPVLAPVPAPVLVLALVLELELPLLVSPADEALLVAEAPAVFALLVPAAVNDSDAGVEKLRVAGELQEARKPTQRNKVRPRKFFREPCPRTPRLELPARRPDCERF